MTTPEPVTSWGEFFVQGRNVSAVRIDAVILTTDMRTLASSSSARAAGAVAAASRPVVIKSVMRQGTRGPPKRRSAIRTGFAQFARRKRITGVYECMPRLGGEAISDFHDTIKPS